MFDTSGCTGEQLAARLVANEADLGARECEVLVLAAGRADLYDLDTAGPGSGCGCVPARSRRGRPCTSPAPATHSRRKRRSWSTWLWPVTWRDRARE